jgi:hypothetical protein
MCVYIYREEREKYWCYARKVVMGNQAQPAMLIICLAPDAKFSENKLPLA